MGGHISYGESGNILNVLEAMKKEAERVMTNYGLYFKMASIQLNRDKGTIEWAMRFVK